MFEIGSQINEVRIDGSLNKLREDLDYFSRIGLEVVEIPPHGLDVIRNGKLVPDRMKRIREILRDYPFVYTVHAPNPLNLMETENGDVHLSVFRSSLHFSLEIGAEILVYHGGRFRPEETFLARRRRWPFVESNMKKMDREIRLLQQLAEEFPEMVIAIENARPYRYHSPYSYAERLKDLAVTVQTVSRANVGITLDFGHLNLSSCFYREDPLFLLAKAAPWIKHCHVHDNFGQAVFFQEKQQTHQLPFGKGDSHMPVGQGNISFTAWLNIIMPRYQGYFILELRSRHFPETAAARDRFRQLLSPFLLSKSPSGH
jgi:sugar phosphate isomerase/epimerase